MGPFETTELTRDAATRRSGLYRPFARVLHRVLLLVLAIPAACAVYQLQPLPVIDLESDPIAVPVQELIAHERLSPAPIDLTIPLSDLDLARLMLVTSPEMAALRSRVDVAEAQLFAAGILPDPQLSLSIAKGSASGLVTGLAAGLAFDFGALLSAQPRRAAARANAGQIRHDVAWSEWLAINQVRTLVVRIQNLSRQRQIVAPALQSAREILLLTRTNLARGDARIDDSSLSLVAFLDAQDRAQALARSLASARLELNASVGVLPATVIKLKAVDPNPHQLQAPLELTRRALDARLDLIALREGYQAHEQNLRTTFLLSVPLPQLALSRDRDTSAIWTTGAAAAISLPLWNRNRGDIAVARATRTQLAAEYQARVHQMRADIAALIVELDAIEEARSALAAELPELRTASAILAAASLAGDVSRLSFETVRAALLDKELSSLALELSFAENSVALETAVGEFLWEVQ